MATTQYIGARYVPKIFQNPDDNSNDWKAGLAYEPLTIVSYAGGSYTSKTAVPASAGNPADTPAYWVSIGLYSGQTAINTNSILQIRHAIASHTEAGNIATEDRTTGDILWIEGALYRCTADVAVGESYVTGVNIVELQDMAAALDAVMAAITQAQSDISDLSDVVTSIDEDYTLLIGDSYAEGYDPGGNNDGWCSYLLDLGVNGQSAYAGGGGFYMSEGDTRAPLYLLQNMVIPDGKTVKKIVVCEGYNDFGRTSADIISHIRNFVSYCNATFPEAVVYIGMCGYAWTHNENSITGQQICQTAIDYKKACEGTNAIFMTQVIGAILGVGGLSNSDYKHPNMTGNKAIAEAIWCALHGNDFTAQHNYSIACDKPAIGLTSVVNLDICVKNGSIIGRVRFDSFAIDHSSAVSLYYIVVDPPHFPCLPPLNTKIANVFHNEDTANGLSKSYYCVPIEMFNAGYASTVEFIFNIINDSGTNFGASKKMNTNDAHFNSFACDFLT